ncbi:MAG: hypothetical protein IJF83_12635 [Methanobrevibacter sp.]|nr:hypothetical protein [Methanobrevibacter sp.]
MEIEDNHNHFCIYCGSKLDFGQNFCSECGRPVFKSEPEIKKSPSKYDEEIAEAEMEYDVKQSRAKELVEKQFDPNHLAYERFMSSITKSNNLFSTQLDIAKKMSELNNEDNPFVEKELDNKIKTLHAFIDKMEDLINELIIHMSSNKEDNENINNLFNDLDDLIDSVKDY